MQTRSLLVPGTSHSIVFSLSVENCKVLAIALSSVRKIFKKKKMSMSR